MTTTSPSDVLDLSTSARDVAAALNARRDPSDSRRATPVSSVTVVDPSLSPDKGIIYFWVADDTLGRWTCSGMAHISDLREFLSSL
jgi:hypothetical protein